MSVLQLLYAHPWWTLVYLMVLRGIPSLLVAGVVAGSAARKEVRR